MWKIVRWSQNGDKAMVVAEKCRAKCFGVKQTPIINDFPTKYRYLICVNSNSATRIVAWHLHCMSIRDNCMSFI